MRDQVALFPFTSLYGIRFLCLNALCWEPRLNAVWEPLPFCHVSNLMMHHPTDESIGNTWHLLCIVCCADDIYKRKCSSRACRSVGLYFFYPASPKGHPLKRFCVYDEGEHKLRFEGWHSRHPAVLPSSEPTTSKIGFPPASRLTDSLWWLIFSNNLSNTYYFRRVLRVVHQRNVFPPWRYGFLPCIHG